MTNANSDGNNSDSDLKVPLISDDHVGNFEVKSEGSLNAIAASPADEVVSCTSQYGISYQQLVRQIAREPWVAKFVFRQKNEYFQDSATSLSDNQLSRAFFVNCFLNGVEFITEKMWPAVLTGLLIADISYYYSLPLERYGNTIGKIFLGTANNQLSFGSNLGSYLVEEWKYWFGFGILLGVPSIVGLASLLYGWRNRIKLPQEEIILADKYPRLHELLKPKQLTWSDVIRWLCTYSKIANEWANLEFSMLWDKKMEPCHDELLGKIRNLANNSSVVAQINALTILAKLVDHARYNEMQISERISVVGFIEQMTKYGNNFRIRSLYANYLLWTLGKNKKVGWHILSWVFPTLYLFYAKARFWEIIVRKIIEGFNYYFAEKNCHDQNKVWQYMPQVADYVCSVCGDWQSIYYNDIFTGQACLDGFLAKPRSLSDIFAALKKLSPHGPFSHLNLAKQSWSDWMQPEWKEFLQKLKQMPIRQLETLNLSRAIFNPYWIQNNKIQALIDFLQNIPVRKLDFRNQGIGAYETEILMNGVRNSSTEYLDLSGNALHDDGASAVARNFPQHIITLKLGDNEIGDYGICDLTAKITDINNSSLVDIDLRHNKFGLVGLECLSYSIMQNNLIQLDISYNDLSQSNFTEFGIAVASSSIRSLKISSCSLADNHFYELAQSFKYALNLRHADLSGNYLTDTGMNIYGSHLHDSYITHINFNNCYFTDNGIIALADFATNASFNSIELQNNHFTPIGAEYFIKMVSQNNISTINFAGNKLGDGVVLNFTNLFRISSKTIADINLSDNDITDKYVVEFFYALSNRSVTHLNLAYNKLGSQVGFAFSRVAPQVQLTSLNVGYNLIDSVAAKSMIDSLPKTKVQYFDLQGNPTTKDVALNVAENLIAAVPNIATIGQKFISYDQKRALGHARCNTQLIELNLDYTQTDDEGARALCRVLPDTNIDISYLHLRNNPINPDEVDIDSCQTSGASRAELPHVLRVFTNGVSFVCRSLNVDNSANLLFSFINRVFSKFSDVIDGAIDAVIASTADYASDVVNQCPSYFPKDNPSYWTNHSRELFFNSAIGSVGNNCLSQIQAGSILSIK